jgi:hypothetical protein
MFHGESQTGMSSILADRLGFEQVTAVRPGMNEGDLVRGNPLTFLAVLRGGRKTSAIASSWCGVIEIESKLFAMASC